MDYLKCIVVQYLVKPPGSSERTALLPVLATLLQFDSNEPLRKGSTSCHKVSWSGLADEHPAPMLPPSSQTIPPAPTLRKLRCQIIHLHNKTRRKRRHCNFEHGILKFKINFDFVANS
eukprot:scaffold5487_cov153-Skeletonema_marinoi.AAC.16